MSLQKVDSLIASVPYRSAIPHLQKLRHEFSRLEQSDFSYILLAREQLNNLAGDLIYRCGSPLPSWKPTLQVSVVQGAIYVLKRLRGLPTPAVENDLPEVTDHAFCSALRRLGYDLRGFKEKARDEAVEKGLRVVRRRGVIVTFLPKVQS